MEVVLPGDFRCFLRVIWEQSFLSHCRCPRYAPNLNSGEARRDALVTRFASLQSRIFERAIAQPIVRDDPWHHLDQLTYVLLLWRAHSPPRHAARNCARRRRSLNNLMAREPMGLSSRRRLILLASHRMALTGERKNSSRIAWEIEIFSILVFGFWEKKYREMEFQPLENESSPFCRTEWFHIHVKTAFVHLSVWLIGQGGWKLRRRPRFDSWQFLA